MKLRCCFKIVRDYNILYQIHGHKKVPSALQGLNPARRCRSDPEAVGVVLYPNPNVGRGLTTKDTSDG